MNMPEHDLDRAVCHGVEEPPVVRDKKQRPAMALKIILQPFYRLDVKMIGRLVKKQDIRLGQQNLRQFDTHVPALAESLGLPAEILILESQTEKSLLRQHLRRL